MELPYTPPELLDPGAAGDILSDMYSLGAVTYALLTGRAPFVGKSPEAIREQIRNDPPERPNRLQRQIPMEMQAVVLRLLAKRPEDRHALPAELLAELQRIAAKSEEE